MYVAVVADVNADDDIRLPKIAPPVESNFSSLVFLSPLLDQEFVTVTNLIVQPNCSVLAFA